MAEAFASRLGERFADTVTEAATRVWLFQRNHQALAIDTANLVTTIELPDILTDDARLALIELDVMADDIRGKPFAGTPTSRIGALNLVEESRHNLRRAG